MPNGKKFPQQKDKPTTSDGELEKIIKSGDVEALNVHANNWGEYFAYGGERDKLSSSQIRNVLDRLQRMKAFDLGKLQLLRPLLAYAAGRHGGKVKDLQRISDKAIQLVRDNSQFVNFKNFFEAIVAYHRYHGGK